MGQDIYFPVSDIYTELEVTVLDDVDKSFLGKVKKIDLVDSGISNDFAPVGYSPDPHSVW